MSVLPVRVEEPKSAAPTRPVAEAPAPIGVEDLGRLRLRLYDLAMSSSCQDLLRVALDEIEQLTQSQIGFFHFVGADQRTLSLQVWSTRTTRHFCTAVGAGAHYDIDKAGVWVDCVRERRPVVHNDYASLGHKKGLPDGHAPVVRELCVPILREGLPVAVLGVGNKATEYTSDDVRAVDDLANAVWEVAERKRAEERLRDTLDLNEKLMHAASFGTMAYRADGQCVLANPAAARVIGAPMVTLLAQNFRELASWKHSGLLEVAEEVLADGASRRLEVHMNTSFGREVWCDCTLATFESQGQPHLLLGFSDVTERRLAVDAAIALHDELERSNHDLEQFAFVASHDLKAPARAIHSIAGWLEEDLGAAVSAESRNHLRLLRQRTERMERLLDDLLAYSRAGRVNADVRPVDVGDLLAQITALLAPPPGFVVRGVPPLPVFDTARTPLTQVLQNLVANAIKHHDRREALIEVRAREDGAFYELVVEDDGPGIPEQHHERIFGMFETLRPRDEVEGSGIGLALVRRLVEHYGGRVTVANRPGRGSAFRFTWPRVIGQGSTTGG
jgi:signal transduction histidine kinase